MHQLVQTMTEPIPSNSALDQFSKIRLFSCGIMVSSFVVAPGEHSDMCCAELDRDTGFQGPKLLSLQPVFARRRRNLRSPMPSCPKAAVSYFLLSYTFVNLVEMASKHVKTGAGRNRNDMK